MKYLLLVLWGLCSVISTAHPGWGIAVDSNGNIFFTDIVNRTIWKLEDGKDPKAFIKNVWSHSILIDGKDNLYFENEEYKKGDGWISLKKASPDGRVEYVIKPVKYGEGFNSPNFAVDEHGNIYFTKDDRIYKRFKSGKNISMIDTGLNQPHYLTIQRDNHLYLVDIDGIKRISLSGVLETVAENITIDDPPDNPYPDENPAVYNRVYGITLDDEGNIYYAYHGNSRVYKINSSGMRIEIHHSKEKWYPLGLVWHNGSLIVLEEGHAVGAGPQAIRVLKTGSRNSIDILTQIGSIDK